VKQLSTGIERAAGVNGSGENILGVDSEEGACVAEGVIGGKGVGVFCDGPNE
jgi:hypothetical protein